MRTVDNSWWWAQKMPETCRVLRQNKCWIFAASSWLFYTKLVTMHCHLNIKMTGCQFLKEEKKWKKVFCAWSEVNERTNTDNSAPDLRTPSPNIQVLSSPPYSQPSHHTISVFSVCYDREEPKLLTAMRARGGRGGASDSSFHCCVQYSSTAS